MEKRFEQLADEARSLMAEHSVPGMAFGMVIDGESHIASLGVTSVENPLDVTDGTLFQIGSTTKTVTATVVMRLVEAGKLSIDDRVRDHIPEFRLHDEQVADMLTVRNLLNHTAGFAGDLFRDTGQGPDALAEYVSLMRDLVQLIPPGKFAVYNNAGFTLLGLIIERSTEESFEEAVTELVLQPLGLEQSFFDPADVMLRRFVVGHKESERGPVVVSRWHVPRAAYPAGGIVSTVGDQLRYARFHMGGGTTATGERLLSAESIDEMRRPAADFGDHARVGLSWHISDLNGTRLLGHGGATNGQKSDFWMVPDRSLAYVSLTNSNSGRLLNMKLGSSARKLFLGYERPEENPIEVDDFSPFVGRYRLEPSKELFDVRVENGELVIVMQRVGDYGDTFDQPDTEPEPSRIQFHSDSVFTTLDGDLEGMRATFLRDETGEVTHIHTGRLLIKES